MRIKPITRSTALLAAFCTAWGQNAAPLPRPPADDTILINVNLVQVDAVVTDSKHHLVANLEAGDFQILQDGKPQKITNFSYVDLRPAGAPAPEPMVKTKGVPPPPPAVVRPEHARRMLALVVDDLGLSFESVAHVRDAMKKFVDRQMQPGDLAAVIQTGRGMGALQQFTADKRVLYAAIDRVRFNALGRVNVDGNPSRGAEEEGIVAQGSLGMIRYIVDGLRDMPGRKAVVLFSQNIRLFNGNTENDRVMQGVRELEDAANRASVVIYSIDPSGLDPLQPTAAAGPMSARRLATFTQRASNNQFRQREGLALLAEDTGGRFIYDTNDVPGALRDAVDDTQGYYLLGYHPDASTFDANGRPKFHNVKVKVLRAGLEVRSRSGFFGRSDLLERPKPTTPEAVMRAALTSPFGASGIHVRLTTLYAQAPAGAFVDAMLLIDVKDLKFTDQPDGWHKAVFDVVAVTFDVNGQPTDTSNKSYTVQLKNDAYEAAIKNGLLYTLQHPVKKPGAYQMRIAVRDADSNQVGSANEFIEVPDLSKGKLTLSSLLLRKYDPIEAQSAPKPEAEPKPGDNAGPAKPHASGVGTVASRIFQPGDQILYGYQILNPNQKPDIETSARVFRDGREIYAGKPRPLEQSEPPQSGKEMVGGGILQLGNQMQPGDYVVQIVVNDKGSKSTATQWADFQVAAPGGQQ
jgi:VWFA-related protein